MLQDEDEHKQLDLMMELERIRALEAYQVRCTRMSVRLLLSKLYVVSLHSQLGL